MSDSDDDLLALADVGSDDEEQFTFEGKYRDEEDKAKLLAMPEIEREAILYDRAQEQQRLAEKTYLKSRREQLRNADPSEAPPAKRQRGTTGVNSSTKTSLEQLKQKRSIQQRKLARGVSDGEYSSDMSVDSESEEEEEAAHSQSDSDLSDDGGQGYEEATFEDVNKIRWGKSLFQKYAFYPGFEEAVAFCYVRVNIGKDRYGEPVYRLGYVDEVIPSKPYTFMNRTVDQQLLVSIGKSQRPVKFSICSDSPVTREEFEKYEKLMHDEGLQLTLKTFVDQKFKHIRNLSKHVLTSTELDEMVAKRAKLNGTRGANAVLKRAELLALRDEAQDTQNQELLKEVNAKLEAKSKTPQLSRKDQLAELNERNRKMNSEFVKRAEVQSRRKPHVRKVKTSNPVPLAVVDDLIANVDVFIDLDALV